MLQNALFSTPKSPFLLKMQCVLNSALVHACLSCMNVNGVMFFSLKDEMCLNDVQVVIDKVQRHE